MSIKASIHFEDDSGGEIIVPLDRAIQMLLYKAYNEEEHKDGMSFFDWLDDKALL